MTTPQPNAEGLVLPARLGEPRFDSPLKLDEAPGGGRGRFVPEQQAVRLFQEVGPDGDIGPTDGPRRLEKAGPRRRLFFDPPRTRAAIVTCGGLCPGLNSVIRSAFLELHFNYGVAEVLGLRDGFLGLNAREGPPPVALNVDFVSNIHKEGGTLLGTSRGPQPVDVMVDFLVDRQIDILLCVGGDGTQRGTHAVAREVIRRGLPISVVGIPKTIDNDLAYCEPSFGFLTAVEEASRVLHLAHTEARAGVRGLGLVKLMGRHAGFIACTAAIVSQEVNVCMIPEVPFALEGPGGLLAYLEGRMDAREHALVVVAEGAGQHLFPDAEAGVDKSGNRKLGDIGPFLKSRIVDHFQAVGKPVDLKYIDPSYIIRSVAPSCEDSILCDQFARGAVHAAMTGRTDLIVGLRHGAFVHVPLELAAGKSRQVDLDGELWGSVLATTGQPPRFGM
jgi:6-phosphofructokinase 1